MALRDWQIALGHLVEARSAGRPLASVGGVLDGLALDAAERAWLDEVTASRGFALTSYVPRWWRETRVGRSARLTLAALGAAAEARLADYQRAVPNFTLFFVPEGIAFLDYIIETCGTCGTGEVAPHVRAVARFERAMWSVRVGPAAPGLAGGAPPACIDAPLVRHPAAALIAFEAEPERVLGALLQGQPLPAPEAEPSHVLVAPGLPGHWRPVTPDEARAFLACEPAMTAAALQAASAVGHHVVAQLVAARALVSALPA